MVLADGVGAAAFATATIDSSTRTLTATNTWEDVASATFTAVTGATYLVMPFLSWRWNSTNWQHHLVRAVVDGVTTGVTPTSVPLSISDNNPDNQTTFENSTPLFLVSGLAATAHTLKIQSADNNSGVDRVFGYTQIAIVLLSAQGPQGDPGGIINWTGQWSSGTSYVSDDAVSWKGSSYVARTASTAIEPGVTGGWATYWMVLAGLDVNSSIEVTLGDGVTPLTTGVKGYLELPFSGVIRSARMVADASGSAQVDIWRDSYANFPPVNADSITSTNELKLISAQKYEDVTLTGWSTSLTAGDWLAYNVDSATTVKQVTVSLVVERI